jgi:DNA-binding IclR family transcriptional regulator
MELYKSKTDDAAQWVRYGQLAKLFSINRSTVWRWLGKMRDTGRYDSSFLELSPTLKLVKLADFEAFLHSQDRQYLRQ